MKTIKILKKLLIATGFTLTTGIECSENLNHQPISDETIHDLAKVVVSAYKHSFPHKEKKITKDSVGQIGELIHDLYYKKWYARGANIPRFTEFHPSGIEFIPTADMFHDALTVHRSIENPSTPAVHCAIQAVVSQLRGEYGLAEACLKMARKSIAQRHSKLKEPNEQKSEIQTEASTSGGTGGVMFSDILPLLIARAASETQESSTLLPTLDAVANSNQSENKPVINRENLKRTRSFKKRNRNTEKKQEIVHRKRVTILSRRLQERTNPSTGE